MNPTGRLFRPLPHFWSRCCSLWNRSALALTDLVYAPRCAACDTDLQQYHDDIQLCVTCRAALAPPVHAWCVRCGAPLVGQATSVDGCVRCRAEPFAWQRVVALARYQSELSRAVVRSKSPTGERLALALGRLLLERRREALQELKPDVVVPMPLYWSRRLARGANGPDLIASALAAGLGLPLCCGALKRQRLTPLQVEVSISRRRVVQRQSFRVSAPRHVRARRILLVDDVLTTGATAHHAARALLSAGAHAVVVAVVARGIGEDIL